MSNKYSYNPGSPERRSTAAMWRDYVNGMSCAAIGEKYYYDEKTVWARFNSQGLKMRPVGGRKQNQEAA